MRRDLGFGLLWFLGLFALDAGSSLFEFAEAFEGVRRDPTTVWLVRQEVAAYAGSMLAAYLLLGLIAGLILALLVRGLPASPHRRLRWVFAGFVTVWMHSRGVILWPMMYHGVPLRDLWAGQLSPRWIDGAALVLGALLLAREARRGAQAVPLALAALLGSAALLLDHHPAADPPRKNQGPNVIVFGIDALRPDHLASFGYARDTAPELERFLSRARVYTSAFTPEARTWEAWMSVLTGAYPTTHGHRWSLPAPDQMRPAVPMLTDELVAQGYHTRFVTDDSRFSYFLPEHNFQAIDQPRPGIANIATSRYQPNFRAFFTFLHGPLGWAISPLYAYNQAFGITHRPEPFAERLADIIAEESQHERFFLAVHTCLLHTPADRTWPWHQMYGMGDYRGGNRYRYRSTGSAIADGRGGPDAERLEALERQSAQQNLDLYDSGIAMVDLTWARVARALDEGDLWDNTLVIVLSDHGEDFLEDDMRYRFRGPNHGFHPWGIGQSRVLLAMAGSGVEAGRDDALVSLIDVAPTVARALGVELPQAEGRALQDPAPAHRYLFGETGVGEATYWPSGHKTTPFKYVSDRYAVDPETRLVFQRPEYGEPTVEAKDRWVFDDTWWLVEEAMQQGYRYTFFNWREDPRFRRNVGAEHREEMMRLRAAMAERPRTPGVAEATETDAPPAQEEAPPP